MNIEEAIAGKRIWEAIDPEVRKEWAADEAWRIHEAASDKNLQSTLKLLADCDYQPAITQTMEEGLGQVVMYVYGVPPECAEDVFELAEKMRAGKKETNG